MGLGRYLRGVVALVRKGKPGPAVNRQVFIGDASTGNVFEFRSDQPVIQRPAAPRPPTVSELADPRPGGGR